VRLGVRPEVASPLACSAALLKGGSVAYHACKLMNADPLLAAPQGHIRASGVLTMIAFPILIEIYRRRDGRLAPVDRVSLPGSGDYAIGRARGSFILLDAPDVSREHARLRVSSRGIVVADSQSKAGTYLGDSRITEAPWDDSRPIRIAGFELRLVRVAATEARARVREEAERPMQQDVRYRREAEPPRHRDAGYSRAEVERPVHRDAGYSRDQAAEFRGPPAVAPRWNESAPPATGKSLPAIAGFLGEPATFLVGYILVMLPTYALPWLGSTSLLLRAAAEASGQHNPFPWLFLAHALAWGVLCALAYVRGRRIGHDWLPVFPVIGGVFDLVPGLNWLPLVPTILNICCMVLGVALKPRE
jgi:FHA domain